ncbi:MerR family DNA-binding transcriptional regulator [Streptomyces sp. NPDC017056]|uniref:MerR family DNA-binding transcriptional regulator n=1 Tax=Streptomyces sp. NPDC017056 TaxID=3364973 RepID=UPI0037A975CF
MFIGSLADKLGIRPATLRAWKRAGLVRPRRDRKTGYQREGERALSSQCRGSLPRPDTPVWALVTQSLRRRPSPVAKAVTRLPPAVASVRGHERRRLCRQCGQRCGAGQGVVARAFQGC